MRRMRIAVVSLAAMLLAGALPAMAQWSVTKTLHLGGEGGWDYLTVDAHNHRLFVTRSTHTMVVDTQTGKLITDIPGQIRSHGVAIVPALNRGFITDGGGSGAILVFDLTSYKVLGKLATMPDSDGIIYDRAQDEILAVSGDEGKLMTFKPGIDPVSGKIDLPIDLGGAPEFLASDGAGKAYVNLENKDMVAVVDLKSRKVIARWPVAPGGHPVGMSIDRRHHLLFIGCRNPQKMIVMSTDTGKVVADLPIGAGVDATRYAHGQAFASCRDGSLVVIGEKDGKFAVEQIVKTAEGARTMDIDPATSTIYLPAAQYDAPTPGASSRRPHEKPGSFEIVVVHRAGE